MGSKFMASAYNRFGEPNPKATKYKSGGSVKRDYMMKKRLKL